MNGTNLVNEPSFELTFINCSNMKVWNSYTLAYFSFYRIISLSNLVCIASLFVFKS